IKVRYPRELSQLEQSIRKKIQSRLGRGSVEFKIELVRDPSESTFDFRVNATLAKQLSECYSEISKLCKLPAETLAHHIASQPDVIEKVPKENSQSEAALL